MDFEEARQMAISFRDERSWSLFHNPKDIAISISIEAAELLEVFQWSGDDLEVTDKSEHTKEELADILIYCIYMADRIGADIPEIISKKIDEDKKKYPADKARGSSKKYTEL